MEFLPIVYLGYMFVSLYFLSLFLLLYFRNRKDLFESPSTDKNYEISVLVPAWNEAATVKETVEAILKEGYAHLKEIILVDDGSSDGTWKIMQSLAKKYKKVRAFTKKNGGKASALNLALEKAKSELVAVIDADSYPSKGSFKKMVGFFDEVKVGAVTCFFIPRNRKTFFERLQTIEYHVIAFTRKLFDYVDAIYVTPGPLALYRKTALEEIGGFDVNNMTEDIEATWHLAYAGYRRRMCLGTHATTTVPTKLMAWYKQRRRWNIGGLQCIAKYKSCFLRKGMLGFFILPFFVLQLFLGLIGLSIFVYLTSTRIISNYLFAKYSIPVGTPLITMDNLMVTPSFLNYLGVILFIFGVLFTLAVLSIMKSEVLKKQNAFNMLFYFIFYLAVYPFIMISALYHYFKGGTKWR
jgi:cellulose synthase/poly-beta-1,6-N-acetylglucosamine synthase-like glycosyltransferase